MKLDLGAYQYSRCATRYTTVMPADNSCPDSPPPPTSPTPVSPTSTAVSNGDFIINIQSDPEKGDVIEQVSDANEKNVLRQAGEQGMGLIHLAPKILTETRRQR